MTLTSDQETAVGVLRALTHRHGTPAEVAKFVKEWDARGLSRAAELNRRLDRLREECVELCREQSDRMLQDQAGPEF